MRKRGLEYIGACLIALLAAGEGVADSSRLIVRVRNFSRADGQMLSQAEAVARRIFQDAGIETEWIVAGDPGKPDSSTLTVQIFAARSWRAGMKDAFGAALIAGPESASFLADVFFGNIEEAATTRKEAAVLLGHVMAHELGHLLLGAAHTPGTIMSESLGSRDFPLMKAGRVRFNQRQAGRLRVAVALREQIW
jgi:hypothetical protein